MTTEQLIPWDALLAQAVEQGASRLHLAPGARPLIRVGEALQPLDLPPLDAESIEAVFGRYYETGANSAPLGMFADLLEMLVRGELLSEGSTALLLDHMRNISTGDRRIQAGLPPGTDFAQKTGTQIERACNVGVINPKRVEEGATIVVACAEDYGDLDSAEQAFQSLGRALAEADLT